ncbi:putative ribonuclease H-like domain-containing protein [Tanacetum coccineum]|uniref:Ribonuclease H-like domain-containing protein n=1 Tax=Tanacetum coccineum TaxID=301880 RepID=A0ABQ4XWX5_9ASTR
MECPWVDPSGSGWIVPKRGLTCLFAKAISDESKLWHRRLGYLNFKTINKLVKGNLVRGLPSKLFENNQTYVACQKEKQHRASCKSKTKNSISLPVHLLHMDLFGPTFVKSLNKKMYYLVVIDDYSRFTLVFFLATKDETSGTLKEMNQFYEMKGILRQLSVARTPQQNGVVEKRNRTLIKASRTMLADSKLPTTFWSEVVNIACYVQNRVLVVKPHNKTPFELFHSRTPTLSFMRPFRCPVTILNTIDHLDKFNGKGDEGFFVGYSLYSKAFRVFNSRTRIVEENLHIRFSESTHNVVGSRPNWLFDINALAKTMNYKPIVASTQSNGFAGIKASDNASQARKETEVVKDYILLPLWTADPPYSQDPKSSHVNGSKPSSDDGNKVDEDLKKDSECKDQEKEDNVNNTNNVNTVSSIINATGTNEVNDVGGITSIELLFDLNMPALEDDNIFNFSRDEDTRADEEILKGQKARTSYEGEGREGGARGGAPRAREVERLSTLTTPPPSPLTLLSSPLPHIPSPPFPASPPASVLPASPPLQADYGFIGTMDTKIRQRRAEEVGYGIRDVWIDPREAVKEVAPMTLGGVNARVTELTTVQNKGRAGHAGYLCFSTTMYTSTLLDQEAPGIPENMGRLHRGLQTQMAEFQRQHRPAKGPAQPDAPGEAGSSS